MGGKTVVKTNENSTQTAAPPSWTMPGIQAASDKVIQALNGLPAPAYTGDFVATRDPAELAAIQAAYNATAQTAGGMQSFLQGQLPNLTATPTFGTTLPTAAWQAPDEQDLTGVINAAIHPVFQKLTQEILPGLRSSALDSGAYSGDRAMSVVPGQAIDASNEAAQRVAAEIGYEDYNNRTNRDLAAFNALQDRLLGGYRAESDRVLGTGDLMTDRMAQLPTMIDTIMRMSGAQGDLALMASNLGLSDEQAMIDNALARDQYNIQQPFMGLDIATDLLAKLSGGYGTTTGTRTGTQTTSTGGLGSVVQGLAGLAMGAAGFPGIGKVFGGGGGGGAPISITGGTMMPPASSIFSPQYPVR